MKLPIDYTKAHWTVRKEARLQYIKEQYGLCWFCKQQLTKEPSKEVSIDTEGLSQEKVYTKLLDLQNRIKEKNTE